MTLMAALDKRYQDEKQALKEECKPGIELVRQLVTASQYIKGMDFQRLMRERASLRISRFELMSIDKNSNGQFYQQFLVEFEDNTTEYIYSLIGENNAKA